MTERLHLAASEHLHFNQEKVPSVDWKEELAKKKLTYELSFGLISTMCIVIESGSKKVTVNFFQLVLKASNSIFFKDRDKVKNLGITYGT